mgnify:CR=1 FL=1
MLFHFIVVRSLTPQQDLSTSSSRVAQVESLRGNRSLLHFQKEKASSPDTRREGLGLFFSVAFDLSVKIFSR